MNKNYEATLLMEVVSKDITKDKLKEVLSNLTDEDFNGNNGEEYYIKVDGEKMSKLDNHMLAYNKDRKLDVFIKNVLQDNYSDIYYNDYKIIIQELDDKLIVSLSYI